MKQPTEPRYPIWSLLWRIMLFGPILMPMGLFILIGVFIAWASPVLLAAFLFVDGHYILGVLPLVAAVWWIPSGSRFIGRLLQGIEFSSL